MKRTLYQQLIDQLTDEINSGVLQPGQKLPSIRELCRQQNISKSTVLTAYSFMLSTELLEVRSRSGYFVSKKPNNSILTSKQAASNPESTPVSVATDHVILKVMEQGAAFDLRPGADEEASNIELKRCLARAYRHQTIKQQNYYDEPQGHYSLREIIAGRMHSGGSHVTADEIIITNGCQSSLMLALMATTNPGDTVAIESPGFYGTIAILELLNLKIMELPCDPIAGINIHSMAANFKRWSVTALIVSPNYSTPTGACISNNDKQKISEICKLSGTTIIEDDIYGELYFSGSRPRTLHSFYPDNVILCSSFSKSLSPDLRIGWIVGGKHTKTVSRLKVTTSLASNSVVQQGVHDYIQRGLLDAHLRKKRLQLRAQCTQLTQMIAKAIPDAVSFTLPQGGLSLWLELPEYVSSLDLYKQCLVEGITITPGPMFTSQQKYLNFIRLSYAHSWTDNRKAALSSLGEFIKNHTRYA
jgi:DNA-binding transcriptional MocR family regulator